MDTFIARVQAALTFLVVLAWILLLAAEMLGYTGTMAADMKEVVMLAVSFWLMRPRASNGAGKGEPEPAKPPSPTSA